MALHALFEKRVPHLSKEEWITQNEKLANTTAILYNDAVRIGSQSLEMRILGRNVLDSNNRETNVSLSNKIYEVEHWYKNFDHLAKELRNQMGRLLDSKKSVEELLKNNNLLLEAAKEMFRMRDSRLRNELVNDDIFEKLKEQMDLQTKIAERLMFEADEDTIMLVDLKSLESVIHRDLIDKRTTLTTDTHQMRLTHHSLDRISLKPWPVENTELFTDQKFWLIDCTDKQEEAQRLLASVFKKVATDLNLVRDSKNDIRRIREETRYFLHKRLQETLDARRSLVMQRTNLIERADKLEKEKNAVESCMHKNLMHTKLVHTRLENRRNLPSQERCLDGAHQSLLHEKSQAGKVLEDSTVWLEDVKIHLSDLHTQLFEVERDLKLKEHALSIEMKCLQVHDRPVRVPYQSDIEWLAPDQKNSFNVDSVAKHLNVRDMQRATGPDQDLKFLNRRLKEISLIAPPQKRQICNNLSFPGTR